VFFVSDARFPTYECFCFSQQFSCCGTKTRIIGGIV
jgi:hypothetical protein